MSDIFVHKGKKVELGPLSNEVLRIVHAFSDGDRREEIQDLAFRVAELESIKLDENTHKSGWSNDSPLALLDRVSEELIELRQAVARRIADGGEEERIGHEAADVANMAMMVADVCNALVQEESTTKIAKNHTSRPLPGNKPKPTEPTLIRRSKDDSQKSPTEVTWNDKDKLIIKKQKKDSDE